MLFGFNGAHSQIGAVKADGCFNQSSIGFVMHQKSFTFHIYHFSLECFRWYYIVLTIRMISRFFRMQEGQGCLSTMEFFISIAGNNGSRSLQSFYFNLCGKH